MTDNKSVFYGWDKNLPMSLAEKIKEDLTAAMKRKETHVRDTIRLMMGEFPSLTVPIVLESGKKTTRVKKRSEITDDDIQNIIRRLVKSEKIMLEIKKETSSAYLQILESYLPQMASPLEIKEWIHKNIDFSEFKSPMQAMGNIMKHYGKSADGKIVKEILASFGNNNS